MSIINIELISDGDGLKTLRFRADRDYILDAVSVESPTLAYGEVEVSTTTSRHSGVHLKSHQWRYARDWLEWSGWLILREGEFVLGHLDGSANADRINLKIHLNAIGVRFQAALV